MRQAHWMLPMAAQVSAYARSGGSSYGSPNCSRSHRAPNPPVTYIFSFVMASHCRASAACRSASPVSAATSAAPARRYTARTACPSTEVASRTGRRSQKYVGALSVSGHGAVPAGLDEPAGQVEVLLTAGFAEQLDEGGLHDGMSVDLLVPARTERCHEVVGQARRRLEQGPVRRAPRLCDGGLEEVSGAVVLVAVGQVRVPLPRR